MYEALFISEVQQWPEVWCPEIHAMLDEYGLDINNTNFCTQNLIILGFALRLIAFYCLVSVKQDMQQRSPVDDFPVVVQKVVLIPLGICLHGVWKISGQAVKACRMTAVEACKTSMRACINARQGGSKERLGSPDAAARLI
jgi:hypothetical protein